MREKNNNNIQLQQMKKIIFVKFCSFEFIDLLNRYKEITKLYHKYIYLSDEQQ